LTFCKVIPILIKTINHAYKTYFVDIVIEALHNA
jgi:hypothetical protein